jgi:hypothetical protein
VQLLVGNCLDIVPTLPAGSIDAIITDVPYGTTACKWDTIIPFPDLWRIVKHALKPRGVFVTTASQPFTSALVMSNPGWFRYEWIWEKDAPSNGPSAKYVALSYHENILIFSDRTTTYNPQMWDAGRPTNSGGKNGGFGSNPNGVYGRKSTPLTSERNSNTRFPKSIIRANKPKHNSDIFRLHPTQKPVALLEYLIRTYTNPGETVLDICAGSFTTGVACVNTGREFIGIELLPEYYEIGKKRIAEAQRQIRLPEMEAANV